MYKGFIEYISFVRLTFDSKLDEKREKKWTDFNERRKLNESEIRRDLKKKMFKIVFYIIVFHKHQTVLSVFIPCSLALLSIYIFSRFKTLWLSDFFSKP